MAWTAADRIASNSRFHFSEPKAKAPRTTRKTYVARRFVACNCASISRVVQTCGNVRLYADNFAEEAQPTGLSAFDCYLRIERNAIFDVAGSAGRRWVVQSNIVSLLPINVQ
jgi:hypothetical protein